MVCMTVCTGVGHGLYDSVYRCGAWSVIVYDSVYRCGAWSVIVYDSVYRCVYRCVDRQQSSVACGCV